MTDDGVPAGWRLALDPATRRVDGGRVLIGGSPRRVVRLTEAGARWLDSLVTGEPLDDAPASRSLARRLTDAGLAVACPSGASAIHPTDVAVVIPARDAAAGVRRTVAALGAVGEVVVVDDASRDPCALAAAADGATVLRNETSLGPGGARQRGWTATSKAFIAFVDADVEPEDGWLESLLAHFGDPTVGAVAPRIRARPASGSAVIDRFEARRSPLDRGAEAGLVQPSSRVRYVPTALLVVRRAALESVGGFDPALRVGEDVDLVWRVHATGWRLRYEPAVVATHPCRPDTRAWLHQRVTYGASAAPLARRHGSAAAPLHLSETAALTWLAVLDRRPVTALAIGAGATAALVPKLRGLDRPARTAAHLAVSGHLASAELVAGAVRRTWWPIAIGVSIVHRRARPALLAAAVVPPLVEWRRERPAVDPLRYAVLRLVDDIAYGAGVWRGCLRERSVAALRPAISASRRWRRPSRDAPRDPVRPG